MVKMSNLRRTAVDVKAEKSALGEKKGSDSPSAYVPPEDDGARFELEHHHLMKMGLGGNLKSGDEMEFHGKGTVEKSETRSSPEGDRHSATVRFHHGGVDGEFKSGDGEERKALRSDLEKAHGKAEERAGAVRNDKKIPEAASK
jgi:hypothetical protein